MASADNVYDVQVEDKASMALSQDLPASIYYKRHRITELRGSRRQVDFRKARTECELLASLNSGQSDNRILKGAGTT